MSGSGHNGIVGVPSWTGVTTFSTSATQNTLYPVTNLGTLELAEPWRSSNLQVANTQFEFSLDIPRPVSLIVLCRHNLSESAQWRITLWSDDAKTQLNYQSPIMDVWSAVYAPEDLEWEDDNFWAGAYDTGDLVGYQFFLPFLVPNWGTSKRGRIELFDLSNGDGYIQIGMCEVAHHWQFKYNYAPGATTGFRSRTKFQEAEGGSRYFKRLPKPRMFTGTLQYHPTDDLMSKAFELQRLYDIDRPFFWWADPSNLKDSVRMSWLARNNDLDLITFSLAKDYGDVALSFIEVI